MMKNNLLKHEDGSLVIMSIFSKTKNVGTSCNIFFIKNHKLKNKSVKTSVTAIVLLP